MSLVHTCYRITDIDRSTAFYGALGFKEVRRMPIGDEAINVFMNLPEDGDEPRLELTFNVGRTEPYDIGTGYGHIAITTDELDPTLARLAEHLDHVEAPPALDRRAEEAVDDARRHREAQRRLGLQQHVPVALDVADRRGLALLKVERRPLR